MSAMADEYVQVPYTPFQHSQEAHEELCDLPDDTLDPLKIFSYFWVDGLLATICFATNQYALRTTTCIPIFLHMLDQLSLRALSILCTSVSLALASTILVDLGRRHSYSFHTPIALPISTLSPAAHHIVYA